MRIFAEDHYVPILKGRAAEYDALADLHEGQKLSITPLIELMPIPWDFARNQAATTLREHVASAVRNISLSWGKDRRLFVDLLHLDPAARLEAGTHPLQYLLKQANSSGLRVVPVLGLDGPQADRDAVKAGHGTQGACLRLRSGEIASVDSSTTIDRFLDALQMTPSEVDLIIDLRELNAESVDFNVIGALGVLTMVPRPDEWRSVTLTGSTFPADLTSMAPASEQSFPRAEWTVWRELLRRTDQLRIMPTFGDYAIEHPEPRAGIDPRILRISAQLRYTTDEAWLVFKERNIRDYGSEQFIDICRRLVRRPEFRGADFSWGDRYIAERASGQDTRPGNPRMWRKVGTNHHIAVVTNQIASLVP